MKVLKGKLYQIFKLAFVSTLELSFEEKCHYLKNIFGNVQKVTWQITATLLKVQLENTAKSVALVIICMCCGKCIISSSCSNVANWSVNSLEICSQTSSAPPFISDNTKNVSRRDTGTFRAVIRVAERSLFRHLVGNAHFSLDKPKWH